MSPIFQYLLGRGGGHVLSVLLKTLFLWKKWKTKKFHEGLNNTQAREKLNIFWPYIDSEEIDQYFAWDG